MDLKQFSGQGKEYELMLLLDYNEDRSLQTSFEANKVNDNMSQSSREVMNFHAATKGLQSV